MRLSAKFSTAPLGFGRTGDGECAHFERPRMAHEVERCLSPRRADPPRLSYRPTIIQMRLPAGFALTKVVFRRVPEVTDGAAGQAPGRTRAGGGEPAAAVAARRHAADASTPDRRTAQGGDRAWPVPAGRAADRPRALRAHGGVADLDSRSDARAGSGRADHHL